jgi:hypothetical protein
VAAAAHTAADALAAKAGKPAAIAETRLIELTGSQSCGLRSFEHGG